MDDYRGPQPSCDCDCGCVDCKYDIICSQSHVAECEARLFCDVTNRLRCEIKHARCLKELAQLLALTNQFLAASAKKETVLADFIGHRMDDIGLPG
ncbi:MAG: hypothetical protein AAGU74_03940 [Bacillota bacterium]